MVHGPTAVSPLSKVSVVMIKIYCWVSNSIKSFLSKVILRIYLLDKMLHFDTTFVTQSIGTTIGFKIMGITKHHTMVKFEQLPHQSFELLRE